MSLHRKYVVFQSNDKSLASVAVLYNVGLVLLLLLF